MNFNISRYFKLFTVVIIGIASMLLNVTLCSAASRTYQINADDWARPRSGNLLVEFENLRALMNDWGKTQNSVIEIYYPGGEMGNLWANELSDWLVSLGVPSKNIHQYSGSGMVDRIELTIK